MKYIKIFATALAMLFVQTAFGYKLKKSSLLVDEDGKIYVVSGSNSEHEAVGKECLGTFRKK